MKVHPLKDSLINELHNRPFPSGYPACTGF